MLDIGFSEFLVVVVLAVLVLGPDKLPEAMKDFARFAESKGLAGKLNTLVTESNITEFLNER